ncbi:MAG: 8-oxoguanine DNA glycosylase [Firmicutes bacterium]|nr:8-oxoguanine DNA glycosylase [Bacillota bacterium]
MYDRIREENNSVSVYGVRDFELKDIFECGQCFRWNEKEDGSYSGVAFGKAVNVSFLKDLDDEEGTLVIKNCTEEDFNNIWKKYFDLERDYGGIKQTLTLDDEVMRTAVDYGRGIRLLNQDEWETLISFILSQNRNIPLIKKSVEEICRRYGQQIKDEEGNVCYAFPTPEALAKVPVEEFEECKLGYRAKYVAETSRVVAREPEKLYKMTKASYKEAFDYLNGLCGVGPKVANCILLFSMEKYSSFPIDVWVRRLMSVLYGTDENDLKEIREYSDKNFGDLGGFAQQYLFYYARENNIGK